MNAFYVAIAAKLVFVNTLNFLQADIQTVIHKIFDFLRYFFFIRNDA